MGDEDGLKTKAIKNEVNESNCADDSKEMVCCNDDSDTSSPLMPHLSFDIESFSRLKCLERPWDHQEDPEVDIQPYYEKFCTALKEYQEDTLEEKVKEWSLDVKFLLPGITCCIRHYVDSLTNESEVKTFEERLADWVEFGLSLEIAERFDSESLKHIELGCCLARRIFLMRRRQFASKLVARHILHRLIDVIESPKFSIFQRCRSADALFTSLFHCSATIPVFFNQVEADLSGKTCYARVVHLLMQKLPIRITVALRPIIEFASFAYSSFLINDLARKAANEKLTDADNETLIKQLFLVTDFVFSNDHKDSVPSFYTFRALYESELLASLCVLITSPLTYSSTREIALSSLVKFVSFDGFDISGAYFLASCSTEVISLCLKIIVLIKSESPDGHVVDTAPSGDFNALTLALRALSLLDELALVNRQNNKIIDNDKRIGILLEMFMLCSNQRSDGGKAMVAALSYSSNIGHLLEIFTFGPVTFFDKHISEEIKTTLRHSVCYGYACEILLTLARLQTDGVFWRRYGGIICRLIDSNFISAASSLKLWTEPLREPMAQGTNPSTIHYLVQRLGYYLEKFKSSDDPPLSAITVLRLIDALLKEKNEGYKIFYDALDRFELLTIFYEENGLQKVNDLLSFASKKHAAQETEKGLYMASDALIFEMLLYSAVSIIETIVQSMASCGKYVDVTSTLALLRIYSVFCCGYPNRYVAVKSKIIGIFSLFTMMDLKEKGHIQNKNGCQSFMHYFFECGLYPSTVVAFSEILALLLSAQLLPQPSSQGGISLGKDQTTIQQWSDSLLLQCSRCLRFIIMSGISSSTALRSSATTICLCLARLSLSAANFVVSVIGNYCSRSLLALPVFCVNDCFDGSGSDSDCDEHVRLNNEIRFGAAADFAVASCFKFLAHCSSDLMFRYAFIPYVLSDTTFIAGVLKYFNVASQKTVPHVCFQKQVIILFRNLCQTLNPASKTGELALSKKLYEELCGSLVEHMGNRDQSLATAVLSLTSLRSIGCFTNVGKRIVLHSFIARPEVLLRFTDRLCHSFSNSLELFEIALRSFVFVIREIFTRDSRLVKMLQWNSGESSKAEITAEKHPLLCLSELLQEHPEINSCQEYLSVLEETLEFITESEKNQLSEENDDSVEEWVYLEKLGVNVFKDIPKFGSLFEAEDESTVSRAVGTEFEPPTVELDLNALQTEFVQNFAAKFSKQREYMENQSQTSRKPIKKKW